MATTENLPECQCFEKKGVLSVPVKHALNEYITNRLKRLWAVVAAVSLIVGGAVGAFFQSMIDNQAYKKADTLFDDFVKRKEDRMRTFLEQAERDAEKVQKRQDEVEADAAASKRISIAD